MKKREGGVTAFFLSLSLSLLILSSVVVVVGGIYAATALNTSLSEELFFASGDRTTRLYFQNEDGSFSELVEDRVSGSENALYASLDEISPYLVNAFVAIEDKRFFEHGGIDWRRTGAAAVSFLKGGGARYGGSTITQQLIKNLTGESERSAKRKLTELIRAAKLEKQMTKREILEHYLNVVNLAENCYGVKTAANAYFSKEPSDLTPVEAATIAAITQNPSRYDPIKHPEQNKERRDVILAEMYAQGKLSQGEYEAAIGQESTLCIDQGVLSGKVNSWFADLVIGDVIRDLITERGMSEAAASRLVYYGGLKIYTTVDPQLQAAISRFYEDPDNFPTHKGGKKAQSAAMFVDPHSGDVLAVAGAVGKKAGNRLQSFATDARRPSGSVIKPLSVYAPALERGLITYATVFDDVPRYFKANGAPWPKNSPNLYRGLINVNGALTHSVNTVSVAILEKLGAPASYAFLTDALGLRSLDPVKDIGAASLALGQQNEGVTLRELLGGYTALADQGVFHGTRSYYRVLDKNDTELLGEKQTERRVMDADNAAILTMMLRQVTANGTAKELTVTDRVNVAGKTGTSGDCCDKWFIGYTPELLAGVWYGFEYPENLSDVKGNTATKRFDRLMSEAVALQAPQKQHFDLGEDLVAVRYCKDSGKLMSEACYYDVRGDRSEIGYFRKGTEPTEHCTCHVAVRYCRCGGIATELCPEECCQTISLLRVTRRFPRAITVQDAAYVYDELVLKKKLELTINGSDCVENSKLSPNYGIGTQSIVYNQPCPYHVQADDFRARRIDAE